MTVPYCGFQDFDDRFDELVLALLRKHPFFKARFTPPLLLVDLPNDPTLPLSHLLELRQSLNLGEMDLLPPMGPCQNRPSRRGIGERLPQLEIDPLPRRLPPTLRDWRLFLGLEEGN